jgi:hypothetical protein
MAQKINYNNNIKSFIDYIKVFEKKKRSKMRKIDLMKYIVNKLGILSVYSVTFKKIEKYHNINGKNNSLCNSLDATNNLVLIFPKNNILLFGGEENMKRISIIETYYKEDFKEKPFNFTIKDKNNILCTSSNIIIVDLPIESIFYINWEGKETTLLEALLNVPNY